MAHKYAGGCEHVHTSADAEPIDNHTCHCSVCKGVTGQPTTHVVFFKYGDLKVDNAAGLKRQPFNAKNPNGPLELCTCAQCGAPIMLDDKQHRIRVIVPNLMGYDAAKLPAAYHAFYDPATGVARPSDGRPVYEALRPDFVWPASAA
ncbi:MAG TPA: GFA family protein [Gammaproteobacteria bacterium]|nr:GFA family protein [Gammaproteobacteria bacterium]